MIRNLSIFLFASLLALLPCIVQASEPIDTVAVIIDPTLLPDELYSDSLVVVSPQTESTTFSRPLDSTHDFHWEQFAIPAATTTLSALFVKTPKLVQARHWVQKQLANSSGQPRTTVDNYLQYLPFVGSYGLYFCGMKGEHNLLDRTIILAMSYATFAVVNNTMKFAFDEKRPNSGALNSFPSGHTGTAFVGAEFLRREYWNTNKWVAMSGYVVGVAVAYLRVYNNRHWINDVVAGASIGYLSTTFAYWLYPKIFRKRARYHQQPVLEPLSGIAEDLFSSSAARSHGSSAVSIYAVPTLSTNYFGATALLSF